MEGFCVFLNLIGYGELSFNFPLGNCNRQRKNSDYKQPQVIGKCSHSTAVLEMESRTRQYTINYQTPDM